MRRIDTDIDIAAPAERVWRVLTEFSTYPAWNSFITRVEGIPSLGARLTVRIEPPGQKPMTFRPIILAAVRQRELRWRGRFLLPGLLDGEHAFRIEERGRFSRLRQSEEFSGLLVPIFGPRLLDATREGFEAMNRALKARAEASH